MFRSSFFFFISLTLTLTLTLWQMAALYQQHHRAPSLPFVREYQVCLQTRLTEDAKHSTLMNAKMSATVAAVAGDDFFGRRSPFSIFSSDR